MNPQEAWAFVRKQADAWENADLDAIPADFAADGVFISPGGRWQGRDAIRKAAEAFFAVSTDVQVELKRVIISGDEGAAEWVWHETRRTDGKRLSAEDAIVFQLRDGKITYWREYFDTASMT